MTRNKKLVMAIVFALIVGWMVYRAFEPRAVQAGNVEVKIDNFTFSPATMRVKAGTQITWVNRDDIPHSVVEENKTFKSRVLDTDEKYSFIAQQRGTYSYYCSLHPKMTARLVVQ